MLQSLIRIMMAYFHFSAVTQWIAYGSWHNFHAAFKRIIIFQLYCLQCDNSIKHYIISQRGMSQDFSYISLINIQSITTCLISFYVLNLNRCEYCSWNHSLKLYNTKFNGTFVCCQKYFGLHRILTDLSDLLKMYIANTWSCKYWGVNKLINNNNKIV